MKNATRKEVQERLQNLYFDCYHDNRFDFDEDAFEAMADSLQEIAKLLDLEPLAEGFMYESIEGTS